MLAADPFASTLLLIILSVTMAVVRFCGDIALERFGEHTVIAVSILCAGVGLGTVAIAPALAVALIGAVVTGAGVAIVYPVALSIAARRAEVTERDVATVSFICFVTLMGSPALVGLTSETIGLRATFGAAALVSLAALTLLSRVGDR